MMGNFLTTLGAEPEEDRAMFEALGLNVGRHPDNAANPRPDNRSGWLSGETPDVVGAILDEVAVAGQPPPGRLESAVTVRSGPGGQPDRGGEDEPRSGLNVRLWDPSTQLRFKPKRQVPRRPDGAPNRARASTPPGSPRSADRARASEVAGWGD
jgi:biotin synthase